MMPDLFDLEDLSAGVAETVRRIAIAGFHALWDGSTPTLCELNGGDGGAALDEAVAHLQARGRIEVAPDGRLLAVHGLSRRPTRHRIEHRGGSVNTWCALDAIGIPAALGIDARAVTTCPSCNHELIVTLASGSAVPLVGVVLWYPETADAWEHLVDQFCSGANLFCNFDHLQDRMGTEGAGGAIMTVEEVAEIGREAWADVSTIGGSR
jgi:hypothetical protein